VTNTRGGLEGAGLLIEVKSWPLEVERAIPSLPPDGVGATVNIMDVCEDEVRMLMSRNAACYQTGGNFPK